MAGVKGMRWGYSNGQPKTGVGMMAKFTPSTKGKPALGKARNISEDVAVIRATRKKSVSEMSTAELKKVNERLQLEQTYSQLSKKTSKVTKGGEYVKTVIGLGKTAADVYNMVNSPAGKAVQEMIKGKK